MIQVTNETNECSLETTPKDYFLSGQKIYEGELWLEPMKGTRKKQLATSSHVTVAFLVRI